MALHHDSESRIVITGIGMLNSLGQDRESSWRNIQKGKSNVRTLRGIPGIPDDLILGATVNLPEYVPGRLKVISMCLAAAEEAVKDSRLPRDVLASERTGCAVSGHMGDTFYVNETLGLPHPSGPDAVPWNEQWLPNTACSTVANRFDIQGPRMCHSVACASGLVDFLSAVRSIQDGQCDAALVGSGEAIHPLFAAGFHQMRVLAHHQDPTQACRPFDRARQGFVMGEGSAMFILERLDHALSRGARIYAEVLAGNILSDAHHLTGLDTESDSLSHLINLVMDNARLHPHEIDYINAHGTGTQQNDVAETRAIRRSFGASADSLWVSAVKSMLGHLVNAAGSVELAITALSLRDGFAPPTMNLTDPDPECRIDCIPLVGRRMRFQHALKLSIAFGGHQVAVILRRWNEAHSGFAYPYTLSRAA